MYKNDIIIIINLFITFIVFILILSKVGKNVQQVSIINSSETTSQLKMDISTEEEKLCRDTAVVSESQKQIEPQVEETTKESKKLFYDKVFTDGEKTMLAEIAMAEAEGQDIKTKMLVIAVILNRVESDNFPDSISEVIFQNDGQTYQFSPVMQGGRWWTTLPNKECYEAVYEVLNAKSDFSEGALYFESCSNSDNWHSRNLTYLFKYGNLRFYK